MSKDNIYTMDESKAHSFTLIHCEWAKAPFNKWERLWAILLLPITMVKFIWTGNFIFLRKEAANDKEQ